MDHVALNINGKNKVNTRMELLGYSEAMKNSLKCFGLILICRVSHEKRKKKRLESQGKRESDV